jgi:hypothetical protein
MALKNRDKKKKIEQMASGEKVFTKGPVMWRRVVKRFSALFTSAPYEIVFKFDIVFTKCLFF